MEWAQRVRMRRFTEPILIQLYSEVLQKFRLAAQGKRPGRQPPAHLRGAHRRSYFDPLPFYYAPLEAQQTDLARYPLSAVTQRPMAMYHSWDSQNAWLRQIHAHNYLFVNPAHGAGRGHRRRRLDVGRIAVGQGALHGALLARRSSRARCGRGTRSARRRAPGASRPTRTSRSAGSCSTI